MHVADYERIGTDAGLTARSKKHVMRNPSRGMALWIKLKRDIKTLLPVLHRLDQMILLRKPENVEYFTTPISNLSTWPW